MAPKAQKTLDIPGVLAHMVLAPKSNLATKAKLNKDLDKLDSDDFFGFENVESQLEELQAAANRDRLTIEMAEHGFPELDYSFLAWRKKDSKLPAFMVLDLESNKFALAVEANGSVIVDSTDLTFEFDPSLPKAIQDHFEEAIIYLGKLSSDKFEADEIAITALFHGVMPSDVRKKTRKALDDDIFDEIYIICEAPAWKINKTGRTDKKDPLVVGWIDETSQMYLIASFDITSLEDYLLTQFKK